MWAHPLWFLVGWFLLALHGSIEVLFPVPIHYPGAVLVALMVYRRPIAVALLFAAVLGFIHGVMLNAPLGLFESAYVGAASLAYWTSLTVQGGGVFRLTFLTGVVAVGIRVILGLLRTMEGHYYEWSLATEGLGLLLETSLALVLGNLLLFLEYRLGPQHDRELGWG